MPVPYSKTLKILFWTALITSYILAILPQEMAPTIGDLSDKTLHFLAFAVLMFLLNLAYPIRWYKAALYLLFYAGFIEFSQYFTPNRCSEWLDILADAIGIVIGLLLYFLYAKARGIRAND